MTKRAVTINGNKTKAKFFAFDGCHKIYLLESDEDITDASSSSGYKVYPIKGLKKAWADSCGLRFINTWKLKRVVAQFEEAVFI